jgi:hypothetical protein
VTLRLNRTPAKLLAIRRRIDVVGTLSAPLTVENTHEVWISGLTGIPMHFNGLDAAIPRSLVSEQVASHFVRRETALALGVLW